MWQIIQDVWRPALEILILAVGIYFATRFVRGTRGWPVVIGFVVLLLALTVVTDSCIWKFSVRWSATQLSSSCWLR
jgi:hypothetical protein